MQKRRNCEQLYGVFFQFCALSLTHTDIAHENTHCAITI